MRKWGSWFRLGFAVCAVVSSIYNLFGTKSPNGCLRSDQEKDAARLFDIPDEAFEDEPENKEWENDHNMVHVVLTRFMQHQPNLLHLGRARLELFKAFCLPTMRKQKSRQFLWIIRTDPHLRDELRQELINALRGMSNVVVVGSNARVDDGHFRHSNGTADIDDKSLWSGSLDLVQSYHRAAQTRIVLETGLDADDGLALDFVREIQKNTLKVANFQKKKKVKSWWKLWCVKQNTEWLFFGKYLNSSYGHVRENGGDPQVCITPGLTRVSTPDYKLWRESTISKQRGGAFPLLAKDGYRFFVDHFYIQSNAKRRNVNQVGGWTYIPSKHSRAVRARSPTSAGMKGVAKRKASGRSMAGVEQEHWIRTTKIFGVSMVTIRKSRDWMEANLSGIIGDALKGQCSEGHSCKIKAKETLAQLRLETSEVE